MLLKTIKNSLPVLVLLFISELALSNEDLCSTLEPDHSEEIFDFPLYLDPKLSDSDKSCAKKLINQVLDFDSDGELNYSRGLIDQLHAYKTVLNLHDEAPEAEASVNPMGSISLHHQSHTIKEDGSTSTKLEDSPEWQEKLVYSVAYFVSVKATKLLKFYMAFKGTPPIDSYSSGIRSRFPKDSNLPAGIFEVVNREIRGSLDLNLSDDELFTDDPETDALSLTGFTLMQSVVIRSSLMESTDNGVEGKERILFNQTALTTLDGLPAFSEISHKLLFQK
ncbi:hypothetical protein [Endozoicomonas sp. OPT23]|uniref:hypothetical protein n=1 Tax=Endozoicomonas sp. OPT23 TaxID=2072845 RepID=UPI0018914D32|nr:hypothetical protein [Endozoicomonas sp. OPT23]